MDYTIWECYVETVADVKLALQLSYWTVTYPLISSGLDEKWKSLLSRAVSKKSAGKSSLEAIDEDVVIVEPQAKKFRVDLDDIDTLERTVTNQILEEVKNAVSCVNQKLPSGLWTI